jgi:hypothetical protein
MKMWKTITGFLALGMMSIALMGCQTTGKCCGTDGKCCKPDAKCSAHKCPADCSKPCCAKS